jgi:exosortase/archaeosortase family protein
MRQLRRERRVRYWRRGRSESAGIVARLAGRKGVFVFLALFGCLVVGFYLFIGSVPIYGIKILPAYHRLIAAASARVLSLLGENTRVLETGIFSPEFSLQIVGGCDAIEATGLFVCAVLAFPAGLRRKVVAILGGVLALAVLNLVRVVSLFLIGVHLPSIVNFMHVEIWQGLFIIFAVMLWVVWLLWITRNPVQIQTISPSGPARS